jgi:uncharacterized membrane protein
MTDAQDEQTLVPETDITRDARIWAFLAYALGFWGIVLVSIFRPKNKYVIYHMNQSIVLFLSLYVFVIPFVLLTGIKNKIVTDFVMGGFGLVVGFILISKVIGMVYALAGKVKPLPLIGRYGVKMFMTSGFFKNRTTSKVVNTTLSHAEVSQEERLRREIANRKATKVMWSVAGLLLLIVAICVCVGYWTDPTLLKRILK